jgi:hypothetical protein
MAKKKKTESNYFRFNESYYKQEPTNLEEVE